MKDRKLLFFDIDGTLLSEKTHTVPQSAKEALKKATEKAINKIKKQLKKDEYIINYKQLKVDENNSTIEVEVFFSVCEDITDSKEIYPEVIEEKME